MAAAEILPSTKPADSSKSRFTWLHLSDWHQKGEDWDRDVAVEALVRDLKARTDISPDLACIDAVFFTGDLSFSGKKAEFDLAFRRFLIPILDALGVSKDRLFVIPGNHDLDRSRFRLLPEDLKKPFKSHQDTKEWFADEEGRGELVKPFRDYEQAIREQELNGFARLGAAHVIKHGDYSVGIIGVNSALLCAREKRSTGEINDLGMLIVGEQQVNTQLQQIESCDLRFGLIHHPFEWLTDFDRSLVELRLTKGVDIVLRGHEHRPNALQVKSAVGEVVIVPAGACYDGRVARDPAYANAYNFGTVDLESRQGQLFLRRWRADNIGWKRDDETREGGVIEINLPGAPPVRASSFTTSTPDIVRRDYLDYVTRMYATVDPQGISDKAINISLPLDQVYVSLSAVRAEPGSLVYDPHEEELDEAKPGAKNKGKQNKSAPKPSTETRVTLDLPAALRHSPKAVLLGDPGAGKTTALKFLAAIHARALREGETHPKDVEGNDYGLARLPIFARIGEFALQLRVDPTLDLLTFLCRAFPDCGHQEVSMRPCLEADLRAGDAIVLLDGLDEVVDPGIRANITEKIRGFCAGIGAKVPVVISSRIAGYAQTTVGAGFDTYTLRDMDREQIAKFLDRWCFAVERVRQPTYTESEVRRDARAHIEALLRAMEINDGVRRMGKNPLLLTILALIEREGYELPRRRVDLYRRAAVTLLREWRGHMRSSGNQTVSELEETDLLAPLAFHMHEQYDNGLVPVDAARTFLALKLAERRGTDQHDADVRAAVDEFLVRVREHTGVFVERATGQYGFMHLTFEEYFASRELIKDPFKAISKIHGLRHVARWEEPIRLAIASVSGEFASNLIEGAILGRLVKGVTPALGPSNHEQLLLRDFLFAMRCVGDAQGLRISLGMELVDRMLRLLRIKSRGRLPFVPVEVVRAHLPSFASTPFAAPMLDALISGLSDQNADVRYACASALGSLGVTDSRVLDALIFGLSGQNANVRMACASALGSLGVTDSRVLDALISGLSGQNADVRYACASALGSLGVTDSRVLDALISGLSDKDEYVRMACASALGSLGVTDSRVLDPLISGLSDQNANVRMACASALGSLGVTDSRVLDVLISRLSDQHVSVRMACASALGSLGVTDSRVLDVLISRLSDQNVNVRYACASALGSLGVTDSRVLDPLISGLSGQNADVRYTCASALGSLGVTDSRVLDALISGLSDQNVNVRYTCASALGSLGVTDSRVLDALISGLSDQNVNVRIACASALGSLGVTDSRVLDVLISGLSDKDEDVRYACASALGSLGITEPRVLNAVTSAIQEGTSWRRDQFWNLLAQLAQRQTEAAVTST